VSKRAIELNTEIQAPPEAVFRALVEADELVHWFPSRAESDPRPGGVFAYRFDFGDPEKDHLSEGRYRDVVANERVSYPWKAPEGPTEVEFRLRPSNGATELELTHSGWGEGAEWEQSQENHRQGWSFFLDNLKAYLEGGEDGRAAAMGMKTATAVER
jgi:uncharacterized protein YndB with AHSA1/START domain